MAEWLVAVFEDDCACSELQMGGPGLLCVFWGKGQMCTSSQTEFQIANLAHDCLSQCQANPSQY